MAASEWFGVADQFSWAAHLIVSHANATGDHFAFPQVVCRAFAAEAYLKCLLTIREKQFPPDHNLKRLFDLLPSEDKRQIEDWWNAATLPNVLKIAQNPPEDFPTPTTFRQCLKKSAEAFKEWRYNTKDTRYWWLGSFPDNVRNRVLELRPTWRVSPPGPLPNAPEAQLGESKQR